MTTAQQIIEDAAGMAGLLAVGQTLNSSINATSIRKLNDMLASWESDGIYLGLPELSQSDDVIVDAADILGIKINLCVQLMMHYGRTLRPDLIAQASQLKNDLRTKYFEPIELEIPIELQVCTGQNILTGE